MARQKPPPTVQHLPLTKFRQSVGQVLNRVNRERQYVVVERGGLPVAAVMNIDEFEDYLELRDSQARRDIARSQEDVEAGRVRPAEDLLAELEAEDAGETASGSRRAS